MVLALILSSTLLTVVCCDVTTAGDKLRDVFQQIENQGLHLPEIKVCIFVHVLNVLLVQNHEHDNMMVKYL